MVPSQSQQGSSCVWWGGDGTYFWEFLWASRIQSQGVPLSQLCHNQSLSTPPTPPAVCAHARASSRRCFRLFPGQRCTPGLLSILQEWVRGRS